MPNDIMIDELNRLRGEAVGIYTAEKAYNILLGYKGMSMTDIMQNIMQQLQSKEIDDYTKVFLALAHTSISSGLLKQDFDMGLEGMANIMVIQKRDVENKLFALLMKMMNSSSPRHVELASSFMNKMGEIPLYDQIIEMDTLLKQNLGDQASEGESFPGTNGRSH